VGSEEERAGRDVAPRLADGAEAEDGLDREADEDLRADVIGEMRRRGGELRLHPETMLPADQRLGYMYKRKSLIERRMFKRDGQ